MMTIPMMRWQRVPTNQIDGADDDDEDDFEEELDEEEQSAVFRSGLHTRSYATAVLATKSAAIDAPPSTTAPTKQAASI